MNDPNAALVALLAASAPVQALVGTRIYGGELPAAETGSMPRAAVVLQASGGPGLTGETYAELDVQRVDVFSYGATPAEAAEVQRACARALRQARRATWAGVLVHWVRSAGGFTSARDPDAAWPRAFQSFQMFYVMEN